ncbi:hypothetical protein SDC9_73447 [bioreactor metagenome]|uniref:Uncharacterized protein n=2 Tax=root TaxID=1 RepID=A0A644YE57_9ZZZZ
MLWGIPRFDALFNSMKQRGFLNEMKYDTLKFHKEGVSFPLADGPLLNEARRAADWIMERWNEA